MGARVSKGAAVVTLPTSTQVMVTRDFDAPRHLVYQAWTTPELIRRWWHANRGEVTQVDLDLRVGGRWRWVMLTHSGHECGFHGEYRELVPNERMVYTEVFEGAPNAEAVTTVTFTETGGRTTVTILVQHKNQEDRDAHVNSGMEAGLQDALDLLEQAAISLL